MRSGGSAQTARPSRQYTIDQFLTTTSISGASFSADESRILFSSNKTGIWNAYTIPVAGGDWTPVTKSTTDSTYAVSFFPKDDRILLTRDQGGNELNHLYVLLERRQGARSDAGREAQGLVRGLDAGRQRVLRLPPTSATRATSTSIATTRRRYERTLLYKNEHGHFPDDVSGDGKWVAMTKLNTTNDSDIYLWNAETKALTHLTPHKGDAQFSPATFDPASKYLYYLTNEGSEFTRLRRYSLAGGRRTRTSRRPTGTSPSRPSHTAAGIA